MVFSKFIKNINAVHSKYRLFPMCHYSGSYAYFSTKEEKEEKEMLAAYCTCSSVMS